MSTFFQMAQLQLQLFLLMLLAIFTKNRKIINTEARKSLSDMLIYVILPCNIVQSFLGGFEVTGDLLRNCIIVVAISGTIQFVTTCASKLVFRKCPREKSDVMTYGMIVSNSSFIGIPVVSSMYGSLAVMYTSIFQIPIRITMWTAGLALFTDVKRKEAFRKTMRHPCVLAVILGFLLMVLPVRLPGFIVSAIDSVSKCTTAASMIVIGTILAEADWKHLIDRSVLYYCFWRLAGLPILVLVCLKMCHVDSLLISLSVILTGMPTGSTTAILAEKYGRDSKLAAQMVFVSTVFSVCTIPALCVWI